MKKNNETNKMEVCQGMTHGRCNFGWNGKGCSHFHPKPCRVFYTSNGFICEDNDCKAVKHHPQICYTVAKWWVCLDQACLSYHRKWDEWPVQPQIPPFGELHRLEWRKPSKKLIKE